MDQQMLDMMPYITIGIFGLMFLIIVPLVIRKTRKARKKSNNFFPELAQRTGLQFNGTGLTGMYKGYQVSLRYDLSMNAMSAYKTISTGKSNVYGKHMMFPALHVELQSAMPFSPLAIYDPPSMFVQTSQFVQDAFTNKGPNWPKLDLNGDTLRRGVHFYGDLHAAQKAIGSQELKSLLSSWKYTDIRMEGNHMKLTLDNNNVAATIGLKKMYSHEFPIQALDIVVAAAKSVQN